MYPYGGQCAILLSSESGHFFVYLSSMTEAEKQKQRDAFAKRLAKALVQAEIVGTVREIADQLEVAKSTYENWANAKKLPTRVRSVWLAARLGVREDWLMNGNPPMTDSPTSGPLRIEHMSEEERATLIKVWKSFQKNYE
jgi:transcriptional regulator with XRE-family HTH domain